MHLWINILVFFTLFIKSFHAESDYKYQYTLGQLGKGVKDAIISPFLKCSMEARMEQYINVSINECEPVYGFEETGSYLLDSLFRNENETHYICSDTLFAGGRRIKKKQETFVEQCQRLSLIQYSQVRGVINCTYKEENNLFSVSRIIEMDSLNNSIFQLPLYHNSSYQVSVLIQGATLTKARHLRSIENNVAHWMFHRKNTDQYGILHWPTFEQNYCLQPLTSFALEDIKPNCNVPVGQSFQTQSCFPKLRNLQNNTLIALDPQFGPIFLNQSLSTYLTDALDELLILDNVNDQNNTFVYQLTQPNYQQPFTFTFSDYRNRSSIQPLA